MFPRGCMYKLKGAPELVKIMHRSEFTDMSSRLSAASRGNLGEEKDPFQGMNLTPSAQALVEHVTLWDHEFAVAITEQSAANTQATPTIMYTTTQSFAKTCHP